MKIFREQIRLFILIIIAAIGIIGWLWWTRVYENPQTVFWGMFNNSLTTTAVTRRVTEDSGGQKLSETITLELGKSDIAESNTVLSEGNSVVSTETIGTPQVDYTRYTAAKTSEKTSSGKTINFSSIIGIWSKSPTGGISTDPLDHLFGQTLLGIVPTGSLPHNERVELINQMKTKKVFTTNFSKVEHGQVNNRSVDIYQVDVVPVAYAQLLTMFAKYEGYNNVPELVASNYQGDAPLKVQFAINPASRQLVEISYLGSNHTEIYGDYGVEPVISIPKHTISTATLEKKLLSIE